MRQNVCSSAVFAGGRPLCTQILPGHGRPPSTILGVRKLETLGYMVKTASLCVPSFRQNTGVWQTDRHTYGRICRSIYSTCRASFAAHCKNSPGNLRNKKHRDIYHRYVPRVLTDIMRSYRFMLVSTVFVNWIALALLTKTSIPPNIFRVESTAFCTCSSSRMSTTHGRHFPPEASTVRETCTLSS